MSSKSHANGDNRKLRGMDAQRRRRTRTIVLAWALPFLGIVGLVATLVVIDLINMGF